VLTSEPFRRARKLAPEPGRDTVVGLTGLPGPGKTASVQANNVQQMLVAGFKPTIMVVHPLPKKALDNIAIRGRP
jgi:putative protein kinase ArgK-like GTPase of G3E family